MKIIKPLFGLAIMLACGSVQAQAPAFEDMEFELDSTTAIYKPTGKNFATLRSKKGAGEMAKSSKVDSIQSLPVNEIVLVYTETDPGDINERETANKERWENLLKTYPQIFQFSTTYKNVCQCNLKGDAEAFKKSQGFYIYYSAPEAPKAEVKTVEPPKNESKDTSKDVAKEEKSKNKNKEEKESKEKPSGKEKKEKEKEKEVTKTKEKEKEKEPETTNTGDGTERTVTLSDADFAKSSTPKKAGFTKPKKAKDPKACRLPCYEGGDDDLNNFFRDNISISKKEKRHAKSMVSAVRLQLNIDGSIKKAFVTGTNDDLNQRVLGAIKMMNLWNGAVKNGVTVKSEVKFNLKYDKEHKGMKVFDMMINPRLGPKCGCVSDSEMFGE